ncbi:hypothetical protein D3C72_2196750 [compost metagenome]
MDGYRTEYEISQDGEAILPACRRFARLYGYARVLRSAAEQWDNEPDWLINLRGRLSEGLKEASVDFGKAL